MAPFILVFAALTAQNPAEVKITPQEKLPEQVYVPAYFSPDGKQLLFIKTTNEGHVYGLAEADGKNPRDLFTSPVRWDDIMGTIPGPCSFSQDGKKFAVVTTNDGKPYTSHRDGILAGAICDQMGKVQAVPQDKGMTGCAFAGNNFVFLDCGIHQQQAGYQLKLWTGMKSTVIHESATESAAILRAAPDGSRVAFFIITPTGAFPEAPPAFHLRVVDLKTRKVMDSEKFHTGGNPLLYWDAESKGLFYQERLNPKAKTPFFLMRFDVGEKKSSKVLNEENIYIHTVLDKQHIVIRKLNEQRSEILRLSDQKNFTLTAKELIVLGGKNNRLVLRDRDMNNVFCATFTIPK